MYKLVIFDTDNTLTTTKSGRTFRTSEDDWQWMPGRLAKLAELKRAGVRLAVATNQGGVAFGHLQEQPLLKELLRMMEEGGMPIGGLYVDYTHPYAHIDQYRAESGRRKPEPGMLLEAMRDFEAEPDETLFVGDRPEDEEAARAAGCAFQWAETFFNGGKGPDKKDRHTFHREGA